MPEIYFRNLGIASRATFFRWEKAGLRVLHIGGRRFLLGSDLRSFLEEMDAKRRREQDGLKTEEKNP